MKLTLESIKDFSEVYGVPVRSRRAAEGVHPYSSLKAALNSFWFVKPFASMTLEMGAFVFNRSS